jgi:hypothetical protein
VRSGNGKRYARPVPHIIVGLIAGLRKDTIDVELTAFIEGDKQRRQKVGSIER